jgi:hypothetical protein
MVPDNLTQRRLKLLDPVCGLSALCVRFLCVSVHHYGAAQPLHKIAAALLAVFS